jgi:outer membrane protein
MILTVTGRLWFRYCHAFTMVLLLILALCMPLICHAAQVLDYDEVIEKALQNAPDIKMAQLDIRISQAERKRALSLYYPTLSARWNTEYVRDLTNGQKQVNSIGSTVLVQNTMYQSSFMFIASYNLFDFGVTRKKIFIADEDVDERKSVYKQSLRDITVKVLNTYTDLLTGFHELETKQELLTLYKDLALTKERLYKAGQISKIEMTDDAVKAVKVVDDIDNLKLKLKTLLEDLTFYTKERYESENLKVNDFTEYEEDYADSFDVETTPEAKMYDLEIKKKKAELQIIERSLLPQFAAYSNYIWYGNHPSQIGMSAENLEARNFVSGISITLPLFEGFKSNAEMEKAKLEIDRLTAEKERKMAELSARYAKLSETRATCLNGIENEKEMMTKVEEKLTMAQRLSDQKAIEWVDFLTQKIDLVNQKFDLTKTSISKIATIKELQILSETRD